MCVQLMKLFQFMLRSIQVVPVGRFVRPQYTVCFHPFPPTHAHTKINITGDLTSTREGGILTYTQLHREELGSSYAKLTYFYCSAKS